MIDLYTWTTPNGYKTTILLEELGLQYRILPVNLGTKEQFNSDFLKLSPNNKIPAIVDTDNGVSVFESGAILVYLAEKAGKFLPADPGKRAEVMQWLMWQMAGLGPMLGQLGYFSQLDKPNPEAVQRFLVEVLRLFAVMNDRLADRDYIAGEYSIADIAIYPWMKLAFERVRGLQPEAVGSMDNLQNWLATLESRPAVVKGMALGGEPS